MLVAHFAVPLAGAVLVAINTRLSTEEIRYILDHSGCKLLVVDAALYPTVAPVAGELKTVEEIITVIDPVEPGRRHRLAASPTTTCSPAAATTTSRGGRRRGRHDLDQLHVRHDGPAQGRDVPPPRRAPELASARSCTPSHSPDSVYLWTLPMFHCNGWCTPWAVTAIGGTHVCLREVRGDVIWRADPRARRHPPQRRARPSSPRSCATRPPPTLDDAARRSPPRARRRRRPRSGPRRRWASGSCTSTGSPRPTGRTRSTPTAPEDLRGRGPRPPSRPARASA